MKPPFTINRITTNFGIFKVKGVWCSKYKTIGSEDITSLQVMGTDGWVRISHQYEENAQCIETLLPALLLHLKV
jgi:hypothetical protein